MNQQSTNPLVSVCILTYNQESYITQAIESIVTQNTKFPFELILADDGSTDKTRSICALYASKYPHIIRLLPNEKNMGLNAQLYSRIFAMSVSFYCLPRRRRLLERPR
ncbi:MAG: glycosyltransferase [Saprospiraceae bacterium]|nr:glycosyltransferase [Saprospiraceae bacterium]